ncbi:DDB1- and CUL4-associated factor 5 [Euwallacea fornicatus]|uniref:DDB1- and CUL4-associated factor 5 n=1 Tax=Euwallacea fornicatus TaxID=995702 RepID=UPI00338E5C24
MAGSSVINPLSYIVNRQYSNHLVIKNRIFKERLMKARNFYRKDLVAHYGCVNAIEFSEEGELLVSGGDDRRVLLWNISDAVFEKGVNLTTVDTEPKSDGSRNKSPISMKRTHNSNIFCVAFDSKNERIFSGGNDDQVIIHEVDSGNALAVIPHRKPVYGLSINPQKDEIIATAGEDGRLLLYDIREAPNQEAQVLAKQKTGFHSVMFNPVNPRFLVSANSEEGIALWDCRKPKEELVHYDSTVGQTSGISACFDSTGKKVLALRRRLPPVLYNTQCEGSICQFYHPQYYNSCTMKTCSFAGENDEYVLSGSDDFNLYMWRVPEDEEEWGDLHVVMKGHRSIVNQVRYNKHNNLIASSGVEKMIKLWSTIPIGSWTGSLLKECTDPARIVYTHQDYIDLVGSSGERISHDYSDQSTLEDSKMMAFFDSLIQREIEGWVSSEDFQSTDSCDSDFERDHSKLLQHIFKSRSKTLEDPRKQKHNKIAQLIAKKRHRLAKMAYNKAPTSVKKMQLREKWKKKEKHALKQKAKERCNGSCKKSLKKSPSLSETRKIKHYSESSPRSLRYRTRQCLREACANAGLNMLLDTPSTSTGITSSNSSVYRVLEQDSEDEALNLTVHSPQNGDNDEDNHSSNNEEENLVNILPTPLNGTSEHVINALEVPQNSAEMSNTNGQVSNGNSASNGNLIAINNNEDYNNGASTSRGPIDLQTSKRKNVKRQYVSPKVNFSDSEDECILNYTNGHKVEDGYSTFSSDSDDCEFHTPPTKRRTISHTDSGFGTSSSNNRSSRCLDKYLNFSSKKTPEIAPGNTQNGRTSDEEHRNERFRKRVRKARMHFRNRVYANDSDSN